MGYYRHNSQIPQWTCPISHTIQNKNVHISVLNGVLRDMGQAHCGICEIGLSASQTHNLCVSDSVISLFRYQCGEEFTHKLMFLQLGHRVDKAVMITDLEGFSMKQLMAPGKAS